MSLAGIFKPAARKHKSLVPSTLKGAKTADNGINSGYNDLRAAEEMLKRSQRRVDYHTKALSIQAEIQNAAVNLDKLTEEYADVL